MIDCSVKFGAFRLGFTHDMVFHEREPYLERWILWLGCTLRVHRFLASDEDRAVHDHPWWFVTLPLQAYGEFTHPEEHGAQSSVGGPSDGVDVRGLDRVGEGARSDADGAGPAASASVERDYRKVRSWRLHWRPSHFRHRVRIERVPTWTVVVTGPKSREWGFWEQGRFTHHQEWLNGPGAD